MVLIVVGVVGILVVVGVLGRGVVIVVIVRGVSVRIVVVMGLRGVVMIGVVGVMIGVVSVVMMLVALVVVGVLIVVGVGGVSMRSVGGADRPERRTGPQRSGFREERIMKRQNDPDIPGDISAKDLDLSVLQDLRSLSKDNADTVARHMVMAAIWMEDDPQLALRHARAAKDRAGRVSVVRETAGIAAYHAGEWKEALTELRAARRISGGPGMLAVMADCERGLGHPEKALELGRTEDLSGLDDDSRVELAIVLAGARADMGDFDSAVVELKSVGLEDTRSDITSMRLFYAFADCLVQAGRGDEAREWFLRSAELDTEGVLDARERAADLES
ncbi:tetratricopeptide repeat protein [Corynebacterium argentoratense]|uniref:hypothetical protein n=1 Tax=Corynebacterium argentoratense TaxID=42817 RepID=UPI00399686CC